MCFAEDVSSWINSMRRVHWFTGSGVDPRHAADLLNAFIMPSTPMTGLLRLLMTLCARRQLRNYASKRLFSFWNTVLVTLVTALLLSLGTEVIGLSDFIWALNDEINRHQSAMTSIHPIKKTAQPNRKVPILPNVVLLHEDISQCHHPHSVTKYSIHGIVILLREVLNDI